MINTGVTFTAEFASEPTFRLLGQREEPIAPTQFSAAPWCGQEIAEPRQRSTVAERPNSRCLWELYLAKHVTAL